MSDTTELPSLNTWGQVNLMMLALKSGPQIVAKVGNPAGLLCRRIWYSVGKSGVLGITEYRQGRPLRLECGVHDWLHITPLCGIFDLPWHRHQIEGAGSFLVSHPKDTGYVR